MILRFLFLIELLSLLLLLTGANKVVDVNAANFKQIIGQTDLVVLQYAADWCGYSMRLKPVIEDVANKVAEIPELANRVILTRIDCDQQRDLCQSHNVRKYPTVKLTIFGEWIRGEYRGERKVDPIIAFIRENLNDNIVLHDGQGKSVQELMVMAKSEKNKIVGLFPKLNETNPHVIGFRKVALIEKKGCDFHIIHNVQGDADQLAFYPSFSERPKEITTLRYANQPAIHGWIKKHGLPVVRDITFTNAEEITDEGKALLILFHGKNSDPLKQQFTKLVTEHFASEMETMNFLLGDGDVFSHPLAHLGKTTRDVPLICIDSLKHMFLYTGSITDALSDPKHLKKFISDHNSGKLHREFHNGPDPTPASEVPGKMPADEEPTVPVSQPPKKSIFRRLLPSDRRYTKLHDEF